ncbi:DUF4381 domain-containing protein [Photobacterium carnosum]|uniref:DUF4381 domain-containing protein n=1 Tax=Photobacterium carnosum TaxID=2023717 RepID=A0A2N4UP56_9GAMM|nr:DUF4381 domain-containing protein [Photobacterium carnosum]PLC56798.1 hypothetical protein CIK00_16545 [Photobacterium carnosum]
MSIHAPPSNYMLRNMSEVTIPDHVSCFPQTIGWKVVAAILIVVALYYVIQSIRLWWNNRYRREAMALMTVMQASINSTRLPLDIFEVMKAVLVYLNPQKANAFGEKFLTDLDEYRSPQTTLFNDDLGQKWMRSLVQKQYPLSKQELSALMTLCQQWLVEHAELHLKTNGGQNVV